jgi:hypothetical protein
MGGWSWNTLPPILQVQTLLLFRTGYQTQSLFMLGECSTIPNGLYPQLSRHLSLASSDSLCPNNLF